MGGIRHYRGRFSSLVCGKTSDHVLGRHRLLAHARRRRLHPHDHTTVIVHQVVVVVTHPSRSSALGRIGRVGIGRGHQFLLMHWLFGWFLLLQFHKVLTRGLLLLRRFRYLIVGVQDLLAS